MAAHGVAALAAQGHFILHMSKADFKFNAAHFMVFADGTREKLHGHNYHVTIEVTGPLSADGYVVDFSVIKKQVRALCKDWDESTLIPTKCPHIHVSKALLPALPPVETVSGNGGTGFPALAQAASIVLHIADGSVFVLPQGDCKLIPLSNVSVEELAVLLCSKLLAAVGRDTLQERGITRMSVGVQETPNQRATFVLDLAGTAAPSIGQ